MKLLIVEDEFAISELMRINLERVSYQCDVAYDGEEAIAFIDQNNYDLLLLDIMLPKLNGYEILNYVKPLEIPVIFITAKGSVANKVDGLHQGADDYIVKPFVIDELLARVESVLRRYYKHTNTLHIHDIEIHTNSRIIMRNDELIELTNREYELLLYLVRNKNIALYRDVIYQRIWGSEEYDQTRTLDLHIQRLRKKLGWQRKIKTIHRVGYMLEVENETN